ncbi:putative cyclin-dependent kinase F-2 [Aegilops tauschii subsp. strangulata]|uniref:putative cyclin-dependent kinase F-2 n=1 Tax=Aegilops tauschii subsp. strangulata TaxID=200361 RepID=UPI00098A1739|nr:putative cyclin-dependent kinase F-2 [Aegilops tauschii subsp. strangulata]
MSTAIRKRPAEGQEPRVHGGKKPRYAFGSISDYKKLEVLGDGTYGEVFKARDRRTGKKVAVKWVRGNGAGGHGPPDIRAITREAGCLAACRGHESIIEILDVATDTKTGDVFLVMELVADGRTLRESLWRPVSEEGTRVMMEQLLDAAAGVPYEECCVGTLIYTSPEQLEGNRYYGQAVDMWALGCIMAEMLTGGTLFVAETEEELPAEMYKLRDQITSTGKLDLEFLEELSEAGHEVLTGLLAFNPDERMTAAEALEHRWFSKPKAAEHPGFVSLMS